MGFKGEDTTLYIVICAYDDARSRQGELRKKTRGHVVEVYQMYGGEKRPTGLASAQSKVVLINKHLPYDSIIEHNLFDRASDRGDLAQRQ